MPPHGGHGGGGGGGHHGGGGGHHGGGGHGGHHGGGGGIVGGPAWWGGGYPWWGGDGYSEVVVANPCPSTVDPVLGSDGKTYLNACAANQAGATVVKHLGPNAMSGFDLPSTKTLVILAGVGVLAYVFMRKPSGGRHRSAARVRTAIGRRR